MERAKASKGSARTALTCPGTLLSASWSMQPYSAKQSSLFVEIFGYRPSHRPRSPAGRRLIIPLPPDLMGIRAISGDRGRQDFRRHAFVQTSIGKARFLRQSSLRVAPFRPSGDLSKRNRNDLKICGPFSKNLRTSARSLFCPNENPRAYFKAGSPRPLRTSIRRMSKCSRQKALAQPRLRRGFVSQECPSTRS